MVQPVRFSATRPEVSFQGFAGDIVRDQHNRRLLGLQEAEEARRQIQFDEQQAAKAMQAQRQAELSQALQATDPQALIDYVNRNPDMVEQVRGAMGFASEQTERDAVATGIKVDRLLATNDSEAAVNALRDRVLRIRQQGGNPSDTVALIRQIQEGNPDARDNTRLFLAAYPEGQEYLKSTGQGPGQDIPAETAAFNELIKDFTPEQQKTARLVKAGLKGRAVSNAELTAIKSGEIKDYADWRARMREQQKFAEMTGASRAKAIDKGFESISKIDSSIGNINSAIGAIDRGAGVGAVERFLPSVKAASVELDNIQGRLALDVIGSTTFGALSQGELDLARQVALPTGLNSAQLKDFLLRKRTAQQKLRDYYNEQIQFLDQGGTIAGFLRSKERGAATPPPGQAPPTVTTQEQYDALPSGAVFIENGVQYRKP